MDLFSKDENILFDFLPYIRVYKDGHVERFILHDTIPPGIDPTTGAQCKDVVISEEPNIKARVFIPNIDSIKPKSLPIVVHIHGGGFCTGSAFGPITRFAIMGFINNCNVMAVSIDYRLAPEYPLPASFEDCWAGMQWVMGHAKGNGPEPWLNEFGNFQKIFVTGESSGATIAHDVALRASINPVEGVHFVSLSLIHPYFASREPDRLIQYLYPGHCGTGDDPLMNPAIDPRLSKLAFDKVLVCVAEKDMLKRGGMAYYMSLIRSGWGGIAQFLETEEEGHCFYMFDQNSERAQEFIYQLVNYINDNV